MKRNLFVALLLAMTFTVSVWAKERPEVKCIVTLNDGKTVEGWFLKSGYGTYGPDRLKNVDEITITPTKDGKEGTTYKADDVKSFKCVYENGEGEDEYRSLYALKPQTRPRNLRHSGHKYFWMVAYKGKKVIGFLSDATLTHRFSMSSVDYEKTVAYSYCIEGDEVAVTFFVPTGAISIGSRTEQKYNFERFPEMVDWIKSDDFAVKELKKKPFLMLEKLDGFIGK